MPVTTIQEIFTNPWGIVESCRAEIESAGAGGFDKILNRETDAHFPSARLASKMMDCCESTARKWLREQDARYIYLNGVVRYHIEDVRKIANLRAESKKKPDPVTLS